MGKKLCKIIKKKVTGEYVGLVNNPKFICTKCGRVSNTKDSICKSKKLNEFKTSAKDDE